MKTIRALLAASATLVLATTTPVFADATGTWARENGESRIRVAPCGSALCGTIVWMRTPRNDTNNSDPARQSRPLVGQRVFFDMRPNGANRWSGQAYNPEDGRTYSGNMTVSGNTLVTQGCVAGGLICRSVNWTRTAN